MKTFLTAIALIAAAGTAQATTITINETAAPGGDYADMLNGTGNDFGAAPDGTTAAVVNGKLRCNDTLGCMGGLNDSFDAFFFDVADNALITSLSILIKPTNPDATFEIGATLLNTTVGGILFDTSFEVTGSDITVSLLSDTDTPLGPGKYNFGVFFSTFVDDVPGIVNYEVSSTIVSTDMTPVPLPAAMPLLLVGLGGMALVGRRRKQITS